MATMRDVARLAGVSIATVSFTVNNTKPVSAPTRQKVEDAMAALGFRRNELARALASKQSRIIALLYPALQHRFSGTAVNFFTSAARAASDLGYSLVLWPVSNDADQLSALTAGGLVDGVMLMEVQMDDERVSTLVASNTPFTLIGRTRHPEALTYVDIDFENTIIESVARLEELGHTKIALVTGSVGENELSGYGPVVRTQQTYSQLMRDRGRTPVMVSCDETPVAGRVAAAELLATAPETTAIIVMNEYAAFGLVGGLISRGVRVPEDMSVLSISSSPEMAGLSDPQLTLMASPGVELGRMGAVALIDKLEGRGSSIPQTLLPCTYAGGLSTAPVRTTELTVIPVASTPGTVEMPSSLAL